MSARGISHTATTPGHLWLGVLLCGLVVVTPDLRAQLGGGGTVTPQLTPRQAAPVDLTGTWVSVVTEDWRFRLVTPQKGNYMSLPLNAEGRRVADTWDPARDQANGEQCKAYGAPAIMRVPGRVRFSWLDDNTLKIETDAGEQTRVLRFAEFMSPAEASWQGQSLASWDVVPGLPRAGSLKVVTTRMRAGYLRKNGVPYSDQAVLTEYFDRHPEPDGSEWFTVTAIVSDPRFLTQEFITTSHFRKEQDPSRWMPTPCQAL